MNSPRPKFSDADSFDGDTPQPSRKDFNNPQARPSGISGGKIMESYKGVNRRQRRTTGRK